ncbi:unnamed protein product [Brassica oleracea var. botrytis]
MCASQLNNAQSLHFSVQSRQASLKFKHCLCVAFGTAQFSFYLCSLLSFLLISRCR